MARPRYSLKMRISPRADLRVHVKDDILADLGISDSDEEEEEIIEAPVAAAAEGIGAKEVMMLSCITICSLS